MWNQKAAVTWREAVDECLEMDAYLIEPRNAALNKIAKNFAGSWMGASDTEVEGDWIWATNSETLTYTAWAFQQPNNDEGDQDCLAMQNNGLWGDFQCDKPRPYVCLRKKGKSYTLSFLFILSLRLLINHFIIEQIRI